MPRTRFARSETLWAALAVAVWVPMLLLALRPARPAALPTAAQLRAEAADGGYRTIDLAGLRERLAREPGRVLLVDARQEWEYRTGHIPGAVNVPVEPTWWSRLTRRGALREAIGADRTRPIVFY